MDTYRLVLATPGRLGKQSGEMDSVGLLQADRLRIYLGGLPYNAFFSTALVAGSRDTAGGFRFNSGGNMPNVVLDELATDGSAQKALEAIDGVCSAIPPGGVALVVTDETSVRAMLKAVGDDQGASGRRNALPTAISTVDIARKGDRVECLSKPPGGRGGDSCNGWTVEGIRLRHDGYGTPGSDGFQLRQRVSYMARLDGFPDTERRELGARPDETHLSPVKT